MARHGPWLWPRPTRSSWIGGGWHEVLIRQALVESVSGGYASCVDFQPQWSLCIRGLGVADFQPQSKRSHDRRVTGDRGCDSGVREFSAKLHAPIVTLAQATENNDARTFEYFPDGSTVTDHHPEEQPVELTKGYQAALRFARAMHKE